MKTLPIPFVSGSCGLLVPTVVFALFGIVWYFKINCIPISIAWTLMSAVVEVEAPAVTIGRALCLPIYGEGAAFILYNLSPFGYLWVFLFWITAGLIGGWLIEKLIALF